jgi:hypothetical protein
MQHNFSFVTLAVDKWQLKTLNYGWALGYVFQPPTANCAWSQTELKKYT